MKDLHEDNMFGSVRERLGRYEEAPSDELWGKIASRTNKPIAPVWPLWVGGVSLGIAVALFLVTFNAGEVSPVNDQSKLSGKELSRKETQSIRKETLRENSIERSDVPRTLNLQPLTSITTETRNAVPQLTTHDSQPDIPQPATETDSVTVVEAQTFPPKKSKTDEVVPPYKKSRSKFQLYFSVTPSLSFQKIIPNSNDEIIIEGFENRSPLSIKRFGFGIDAGFERDIDHIFGYYGGVSFYRQQQEISYRYFDQEADVNRVGDAWTFEINRPQHTRTFDYSMTNIGVRSGILVTLKGDKLKHKFGAGLIYSHGFAKSTGSYNNSQSAYLSYQLFYRSEVRINEHVSWFVEPTFVYGFLSKEKLAEPFSLKPYRAGLSLGALYRF